MASDVSEWDRAVLHIGAAGCVQLALGDHRGAVSEWIDLQLIWAVLACLGYSLTLGEAMLACRLAWTDLRLRWRHTGAA